METKPMTTQEHFDSMRGHIDGILALMFDIAERLNKLERERNERGHVDNDLAWLSIGNDDRAGAEIRYVCSDCKAIVDRKNAEIFERGRYILCGSCAVRRKNHATRPDPTALEATTTILEIIVTSHGVMMDTWQVKQARRAIEMAKKEMATGGAK